mmetsp:Transcript_8320/g.18172  ORF Transcript_8320/g.18172 Transcript_8320/m.18172 type:complete len:161 (+) Transcript_8320:66-548(+)
MKSQVLWLTLVWLLTSTPVQSTSAPIRRLLRAPAVLHAKLGLETRNGSSHQALSFAHLQAAGLEQQKPPIEPDLARDRVALANSNSSATLKERIVDKASDCEDGRGGACAGSAGKITARHHMQPPGNSRMFWLGEFLACIGVVGGAVVVWFTQQEYKLTD